MPLMPQDPPPLDYCPSQVPLERAAGLSTYCVLLALLGTVALWESPRSRIAMLLIADAVAFLAAMIALVCWRRPRAGDDSVGAAARASLLVAGLSLLGAAVLGVAVVTLSYQVYAAVRPGSEFALWRRLPYAFSILAAGSTTLVALIAAISLLLQWRRRRGATREPMPGQR